MFVSISSDQLAERPGLFSTGSRRISPKSFTHQVNMLCSTLEHVLSYPVSAASCNKFVFLISAYTELLKALLCGNVNYIKYKWHLRARIHPYSTTIYATCNIIKGDELASAKTSPRLPSILVSHGISLAAMRSLRRGKDFIEHSKS